MLVVTGLVVDGTGFEVLAGGVRVGARRLVSDGDAGFLAGLAAQYVRGVEAGADAAVFTELGRELYAWLEGDGGQLSGLLERAGRPVVFEVAGPRSPTDRAWAVLGAPFELLVDPAGGVLAEDALARFCPVRRLGAAAGRGKLDGFRLGLAFMASAPRDAPELDFEGEEAAILGAVGEGRVDLLVEDSGDPVQLGRRLAGAGGLPVVHLSCHGLNSWRPPGGGGPGVPVLWMEDELGGGRPVTAGELVGLLPGGTRLVFVSACLTAARPGAAGFLPPGAGQKGEPVPGRGESGGGLVAHSLASALVAAGVPAVIGWDGSVDDRAATAFAEVLYGRLADRAEVAVAVGDARRVLLASGDPVVRAGWHLPRLWLGPAGGGPVVAGSRKRSLVPAGRGTKVFLGAKREVPVAAAAMFVGRRAELQAALRALRSGERAGVLVHGQGRLGKSSLAARIADRCPDLALGVVFGDYTALAILDAVKEAVRADPAARQLIEAGLPAVRDRPEAVEAVLTDLLAGPCAQAGEGGGRPLLLVIDDLEQILVPDPAGPHRVRADLAPVLAGVLRAFDPDQTDSRLVVTSRFTFTLGGPEARLAAVPLAPLSPVGQAKLQRRQQALTPPGRLEERAGLAGRAVAVSRGNPGLQDLIGLRIVYGEHVAAARAEAAVAGMEAYLDQGDLPADADVRDFLENLALDTLLQEAGPANIALLRAATLFDLPVPEPVIWALAGEVGGSTPRLRGLGLLEPHPDPYDPAATALAADPLAAGRLAPLTEPERVALATISIDPLFTAWGGTAAADDRAIALDLQLTDLALLADDPDVTLACASFAVGELRSGPAADAFRLGQAAIALLDRHHLPVPLDLLRQAADAALTSGDGQAGEELLNRAGRQAETEDERTDPLDRARVKADQARRLFTRGEPERAGQLLRQAAALFTAGGSEREATAAMGVIADIAFQRGDYGEALRIRREVQLPLYERIHEARSAAMVWAKIADIAYLQGDYDEALRIRQDVELPVFERLGDARSAAVTWGKIADIAFQRGEYDHALGIRHDVQLPAYERLGDTREIAITWSKIADIAYRRGEYDEALRIRRDVALPAYERLGDARAAAITWGAIADIAEQRGDYDEALRIRRDVELPAYERLGDTRSMAMTWGSIADIAYLRGDLDEAAELQSRRLEANGQLGDLDGIAAASWDLARIDLAREDYNAAMPRLIESLGILSRLQRPDGIASVGWALGQLLLAAGETEQARQVLGDARAAASKIGWTDQAQQIGELLDELDGGGSEQT